MERLGRYELVARLAAGGMGEIFLARLEGAEGFFKLYAIKRILPHLAKDPRFRKMLIDEAQIASRMAHSNICQVYELCEEDNGQLYIVMEYLEGISLLQLLRKAARERTPLEDGFIANVIGQVCDALQYAHELRDRSGLVLNVIHRDISPANVFVCESGTVKVLDFGIAKVKDTTQTQTDTVKGKYAYMAPEQLKGKALTTRVDVFALGIVTYELLALRRLFQRKTDYLTFQAVIEQPIADLRHYRPQVSERTVAAILRALARDVDERFPTVREFRAALFEPDVKPWSHEQIGELVRARFSDEIGKTTEGVKTALNRKGPPPAEPLLDAPPADDEDADFPAIDSGVGPLTVVERPALKPALKPAPTPPTTVAEAPAASLDPPIAPRRSGAGRVFLVLFALLVVGGGAAALFFLWKQQANSESKPAEVTIEDDPTTRERNHAAVEPFNPELSRCAGKHVSDVPQVAITMRIAPDGKITRSSMEPPIESSPLGTCLLGVLGKVPFPRSNSGSLYTLTIALPQRKPPR